MVSILLSIAGNAPAQNVLRSRLSLILTLTSFPLGVYVHLHCPFLPLLRRSYFLFSILRQPAIRNSPPIVYRGAYITPPPPPVFSLTRWCSVIPLLLVQSETSLSPGTAVKIVDWPVRYLQPLLAWNRHLTPDIVSSRYIAHTPLFSIFPLAPLQGYRIVFFPFSKMVFLSEELIRD